MAKIRTLEEIAQILKKHRKELEEKYNVKHLKIFGSYAKGKQTENSDLDIIVTFKEVPTFFELLELEEYLEKLLGLKIDLYQSIYKAFH